MATSTIPNINGVINVTNKVTFLKSVNTNYTFFYKIGPVVFYQINFNENIASGATVATLDNSIKTNKQFWHMAGASGGGTGYKRVNINGGNITVPIAMSTGDFVSGYFIPDAV